MTLQIALEKACKDLSALLPYVTAAKAGVDFSQGRFVLPFFDKVYLVSHPEIRVVEEDTGKEPSQWLELMALHYLVTADGAPLADRWITYRQLPGALIFEMRFYNMAVEPLLKAFGNDIEGFRRAGQGLKGVPMSRTGDAAYMFHAFPRVRLGCILYLGDEEVSPSMNILFDESAPHYLDTEDLAYIGSYLPIAMRLKRNY